MSDEKRIDVVFGAKIAGLVAGAQEAAAIVKESATQMSEAGEGVQKAFEFVKEHWLGLLAIIGGGKLFQEAIDSTVEWTTEVMQLSRRLGITTEDASGLAVALHHVGVSAEDYEGLVNKLTRQMQRNGDAFQRLGIETKDQNGQWRNSQDVMVDVIDKLNGLKAGTDRNVAAQGIFGRGSGDLVKVLRLTGEMLEESREKAEKYHLIVGPDGVQKMIAYKDAMADLHLIGKSLAVQVGNVLLPVVLQLAQALGGEGPRMAQFFADALKFIVIGALEGFAALNALVQLVKFMKVLLMTPVGKGWLDTVSAAWYKMGDDVTQANEKVQNAILKIKGFGGEKGKKSNAADPALDGDTVDGQSFAHGSPKAGADGRLAAWKEELAAKQAAEEATDAQLLAEEVAFWQQKLQTVQGKGKQDVALRAQLANEIVAAEKRQLAEQLKSEEKGKDALLQEEIAFWQAKLAQVRGGTAADMKLRQQINAQLLAAEKQLHADERRVQQIAIETQRETALEQLDVEKQTIQEKRALRQIDAKQEETALLALNAQVTAIKLAALEEQRALAEGDLVKQAEIDKQIAALKRASAREIVTIHKNTTTEIAKDWDTVFDNVSNVFSQTVTAIINGTQTLRNGLKSIFQNIVLDFAAAKLKELQHHLAIELAKRGITTETAAHKVATEGAAAIKSLAITVATAIKEIAVHAARAAAGAYAAIALIPFVGPVLAPIAAGVALAGVLALGGRIASAEGGYDIPHGLNPVTQLHQDEMVLPASLANVVRRVAQSGAGDEGATAAVRAAAGGGDVHHHTYVIHAIDSKSFEEFARKNPKAFATGVQNAVRNGHLSRTT